MNTTTTDAIDANATTATEGEQQQPSPTIPSSPLME